MDEFFTSLGVEPDILRYVITPLLIFCARILDVSIATVRIVFVFGGRKNLAPILGFVESFIWLLAIGQIMAHLTDWISYFAYAGGYAAGTYIGMFIEEKLALGKVVVRVITKRDANELIYRLRESKYSVTTMDAKGKHGDVSIIYMVTERTDVNELISIVKQYNPRAFYTIEGIKHASDGDRPQAEPMPKRFRFLAMKRK